MRGAAAQDLRGKQALILPNKAEYKQTQNYLHWEYDHWRQDCSRTYSRYGGFSTVYTLAALFKRVYARAPLATLAASASPFMHYVSGINAGAGTITISYGLPPAVRQPKSWY